MGALRTLQTIYHLYPVLVIIGSSLVTVGILTIIGKISLGAFLVMVGGWLGTGSTKKSAKVLIEAGKYKVTWEGVGVGILIAGILIILGVIIIEGLALVYTRAPAHLTLRELGGLSLI